MTEEGDRRRQERSLGQKGYIGHFISLFDIISWKSGRNCVEGKEV
jgi:hypothetical protein